MSAGIYIHVPFCAVKCPYCDFYSERFSPDTVQKYTDAVCRNLLALPAHLQADTVYFGGGTPSLLPADALLRMLDALSSRCDLLQNAEITLEVNPLTATKKNLDGWKKIGINRLSLGMQSFDPGILRTLGRRHSPEQGIAAANRAADAGFTNLSADLMLGLNAHTEQIWQRELETVLSLPITHISSYLLKIEANTPFGKNPPEMLDDDRMADRYLQMHSVLKQHGYRHYEISNFAKPGFESRHNCKYWHLEPYYGIGPAAHSCFGGVRYAVPRDLAAFCASPLQQQIVTEPHAETEAEAILLGLRLAEGISLRQIPLNREQILYQARPLLGKYLETDGDMLRMTPEGWLVSNAVLAHLLQNIGCK